MIVQLQELVRRVILGATAAMVAGSTPALAQEPSGGPRPDPGGESIVVGKGRSGARQAKPKLILKRASKALSELYSFHRSHRSHSSHRSHYSSSVPSAPPRRPDTSQTVQPTTPAALTSLGSRVLRRGMVGADVTQLMLILAKHGYLAPGQINTSSEFTAPVEAAVRAFQSANGLQATGVADSQTIVLLKQLDARP